MNMRQKVFPNIFPIMVLFMCLTGSTSMFYFAWTEWQLRQTLATNNSVLTEATVLTCGQYRSYPCNITYQFTVPADENNATYVGKGKFRCKGGCAKMSPTITIRYLPEDPNISATEGQSRVRTNIWFGIGYLLLPLIPFAKVLIEVIKDRIRTGRKAKEST